MYHGKQTDTIVKLGAASTCCTQPVPKLKKKPTLQMHTVTARSAPGSYVANTRQQPTAVIKTPQETTLPQLQQPTAVIKTPQEPTLLQLQQPTPVIKTPQEPTLLQFRRTRCQEPHWRSPSSYVTRRDLIGLSPADTHGTDSAQGQADRCRAAIRVAGGLPARF